MTLNQVKFLLMDVGLFLVRYWYLVAALVVVIVAGAMIDSCRQSSREKKIDQIEANITEKQVESRILTNQKANIAVEVETNENNSNIARADLDNSRRTDSGVFAGTDPEDKFCRKFCLDSTCFEWRKRHPDAVCN